MDEDGGGICRVTIVYTIGHSTRSATEFVALLESCGIETVVDVRSKPGSKRFPHFNGEVMHGWLYERGVRYLQVRELGGYQARYRTPIDNSFWKRAHFKDFADYLQSPKFLRGLEILTPWAESGPCAIMCSEADPSKCHRSMITDVLLAKGWSVTHILGGGSVQDAAMHPGARLLREGLVHYPS